MVAHLNAWKDEYSRTVWRGPYNIDIMKDILDPGTRILDVGCGNGKLFMPLKRAGFSVTGIDISKTALMALGDTCDIVQGDAIRLPFKDRSFPAAVCYDVLQHFLDNERKDCIKEIRRALKPGGILFIEVFGNKDMRYGGTLVEQDTFRRQSGIIYHYFTEDELRDILGDFKLLKIESTMTQKTFNGENFIRHRILAVAQR